MGLLGELKQSGKARELAAPAQQILIETLAAVAKSEKRDSFLPSENDVQRFLGLVYSLCSSVVQILGVPSNTTLHRSLMTRMCKQLMDARLAHDAANMAQQLSTGQDETEEFRIGLQAGETAAKALFVERDPKQMRSIIFRCLSHDSE